MPQQPAKQTEPVPKDSPPEGIIKVFLVWEPAIKRLLSRFVNRPEDVDELAQETFLRVYAVDDPGSIQSPKSYLFRVAKNLALRELTRKSARLTDYLEEALNTEDQEPGQAFSLEDEIVAQQKVAQYCEAIATLPPQCRKVFLLRKVHALSYKDIAQRLNVSISAVEKQVAVGIAKFDHYMIEQEQGTSGAAGTAVNKELL